MRKTFGCIKALRAIVPRRSEGQRWAEDASESDKKACVVGMDRERFSIDVLGTNLVAAHLYVPHAKTQPEAKLPSPTAATNFEAPIDGKIHVVKESALAE